MADSKTQVWNLALIHLGSTNTVADIATERSKEARVGLTIFDTVLKAVLRDFDYVFARKRDELTLIETDPNDEYSFSYQYPTDCVAFRRIPSGARNDTRQTRIEFSEEYDATNGTTVILTDIEDADGIYTFFHETVSLWPADFVLAMSFRLAYYGAPSIAGSDSKRLKQEMWAGYQAELAQARANIANEEQVAEPPESEFILAREGE